MSSRLVAPTLAVQEVRRARAGARPRRARVQAKSTTARTSQPWREHNYSTIPTQISYRACSFAVQRVVIAGRRRFSSRATIGRVVSITHCLRRSLTVCVIQESNRHTWSNLRRQFASAGPGVALVLADAPPCTLAGTGPLCLPLLLCVVLTACVASSRATLSSSREPLPHARRHVRTPGHTNAGAHAAASWCTLLARALAVYFPFCSRAAPIGSGSRSAGTRPRRSAADSRGGGAPPPPGDAARLPHAAWSVPTEPPSPCRRAPTAAAGVSPLVCKGGRRPRRPHDGRRAHDAGTLGGTCCPRERAPTAWIGGRAGGRDALPACVRLYVAFIATMGAAYLAASGGSAPRVLAASSGSQPF